MSTVLFFFACMSGICAFGFLLAAAISFQQLGALGESASFLTRWMHMLSGGWIATARGMAKNWSREQELRRLIYLGCAALLVATICAVMAFNIQ
jgi:hypothetical protein